MAPTLTCAQNHPPLPTGCCCLQLLTVSAPELPQLKSSVGLCTKQQRLQQLECRIHHAIQTEMQRTAPAVPRRRQLLLLPDVPDAQHYASSFVHQHVMHRSNKLCDNGTRQIGLQTRPKRQPGTQGSNSQQTVAARSQTTHPARLHRSQQVPRSYRANYDSKHLSKQQGYRAQQPKTDSKAHRSIGLGLSVCQATDRKKATMAAPLQVGPCCRLQTSFARCSVLTLSALLFSCLQSVQTFGRKVRKHIVALLSTCSSVVRLVLGPPSSHCSQRLFRAAEDSSGCGLRQAWQGSG
jgi:hypothetical protein